MRTFFSLFIFLSSFTFVHAQVSSADKAIGNYTLRFNLSTENDSIFLLVVHTSWEYKMQDKPKMLIRLMGEEVISLEGILLSSSNKNGGAVVVGNIAVSSHEYITEAKFSISRDQIEKFSKGIKKIRINTTPEYYEKTWRRDKIGKKLYAKYKESSPNSFEDNF